MPGTNSSSSNGRFAWCVRIFMVVGLAVAAIWLIAGQHRLSEEMVAANNDRANLVREVQTLRSAIEKQADSIIAVSTRIGLQTTVMNQALGRVIPVDRPPEWENQLSQIEAMIRDRDRWPKNATEAQDFMDQATSLIRSIPAWAEADYLPRLSALATKAGQDSRQNEDGSRLSALKLEVLRKGQTRHIGTSGQATCVYWKPKVVRPR